MTTRKQTIGECLRWLNFALPINALVGCALVLTLAGYRSNASTVNYSYDPAGRLTSASYNSDTSINYSYDANGNLLRRSTINGGADTDHDGIPDAYEDAHGLNKNNAVDANLDSDGDGATNLQEYLAGTDPNNANDRLRVTTVAKPGGGFQVTWTSVPGKYYRVYFSNDLTAPLVALSDPILANTGETTKSFTDTTTTGILRRFYKVVVVP